MDPDEGEPNQGHRYRHRCGGGRRAIGKGEVRGGLKECGEEIACIGAGGGGRGCVGAEQAAAQ